MAKPGEGWMNDLQNMEKVIAIYELLGGKNEPRLGELVTPFRKWVRTEDLLLREAPFSASTKTPYKVFLFRDLLLIGKSKQGSSSSSTLPGGSDAVPVRRRSLVLSTISLFTGGGSKKDIPSTQQLPTPPAASTSKEDVKLSYYLPLQDCTLKTISQSQDGLFGVQLTRVCRVKQLTPDGKNLQMLTKVEKIEVWFPTTDHRDTFQDELNSLIHQQQVESQEGMGGGDSDGDNNEGDTDSVAPSSSSTATAPAAAEKTGERKWAKNRPHSRRDTRQRAGSTDSNTSNQSSSTSMDMSTTLSLQDLAERYNMDFTQNVQMKNLEEFIVEFGEGQMGFSLSSGPNVGVVIGKLSPGGFAQLGGCEIGDRLDSVNGIQVDMDTTWQRAVEMIKACGRPVALKFTRNLALTMASKPSVSFAASTTGTTSTTTSGRRKWATNKKARGNSEFGLAGLEKLEKMYKAIDVANPGGNNSDDEDDEDSGSVIMSHSDEEEEETKPSAITTSTSASAAAPPENSPVGTSNGMDILLSFLSTCTLEEEKGCVNVLMEIFQTERDYVSSLRGLIREYILPLRKATKFKKCRELLTNAIMCEHNSLKRQCQKQASASGPMLSQEEIHIIFMNLETIVMVNAELLSSIDALLLKQSDFPSRSVHQNLTQFVEIFSQCFDKIKPFFSMYALYCHQYPAAVNKLQKVRGEDDEVDACLRALESSSKATSLRSLLIKPVQRICRYPLLFQELTKRIAGVERVYEGQAKQVMGQLRVRMAQCAEDADAVAHGVNVQVQRQDTIGSILVVFQELGGNESTCLDDRVKSQLLLPSRRYIRSEEIFYREAPFSGDMEPRKLYLFNDLMIIAKEISDSSVSVSTGGGRSGGRLSVSKRPSSLGTLRRGMSGLFSSSSSSSDANNNTNSNNTAIPSNEPQTHEVVAWIDLERAEVKPLPKPDEAGYYGFRLKSIKRSLNNTHGGKVVTTILKIEVWMSTRDKLQTLIADVEDKIVALDVLQQNAKLGALHFGQKQNTRNWIKKKNSREEMGSISKRRSATSSVDGNKLDAKEALAQIQKKYSAKNL